MTADPTPRTELPNSIEDVLALLGPIEGVRVNNHWVPASYLEAFTATGAADGPIILYDRRAATSPRETGVPVIAVHKHLYVADSARVEVPDVIERFLATFIEKPFPPIRARLVQQAMSGMESPLSRADKASLALWVAVQHVRTPHQRDFNLWLEEIHGTFTALVRARDSHSSHDRRARRRMKADLISGRLAIKSPRDRWIGSFLGHAFELSQALQRMQFSALPVPESITLPTSDAPVVVSGRLPGELTYRFEAGVAHADAEILMPLSPAVVLVLRHESNDVVLGTGAWAETVVERVARNADRFLYAPKRSKVFEDLIGLSPKPDSVIDIDGQQFTVGTAPGFVADRIMRSRSNIIRVGSRQLK